MIELAPGIQVHDHDLDWSAMSGDELAAWAAGAPVLTDDYAPVDQLLTPYGR